MHEQSSLAWLGPKSGVGGESLAETNKKIVFHIMKCTMHVNECCYDVVSGYKRAELPTSTEDESYI